MQPFAKIYLWKLYFLINLYTQQQRGNFILHFWANKCTFHWRNRGWSDEIIKWNDKKWKKSVTFVKKSELEKHLERADLRQGALYPHFETYTQT